MENTNHPLTNGTYAEGPSDGYCHCGNFMERGPHGQTHCPVCEHPTPVATPEELAEYAHLDQFEG